MMDLLEKFSKVLVLEPEKEHVREQSQLAIVGQFGKQDKQPLGQFNHIYNDRLAKLRARFQQHSTFVKISMVKDTRIEICGLLHKVYKKIKQNMDKNLEVLSPYEEVYGPQDEAELADESGSIRIVFNQSTVISRGSFESEMQTEQAVSIHDVPHGTCFSAQGQFDESINSFVCTLITFPMLPRQRSIIKLHSRLLNSRQLVENLEPSDDVVAFTSGLTLPDMGRLISFFSGRDAAGLNQHRITTLVICGGLPSGDKLERDSLRLLDQHLQELAKIITVYYLPGNKDFSDPLWPVPPTSSYLLPRSAKKLHRCSNPQLFELGKLRMMGTCGQNVQETRRACTIKDSLQIMESHLMYNHLAPSSPSTLLTAPLLRDPLVLDSLPNVYFAADPEAHRCRTLKLDRQECKLMLVPPFQRGIVLLNGRTAETAELHLN